MVRLRTRIFALGVMATSAGIGTAQAADYALPPPVPDYSGWYLRGDIGFSNQQVGSLFNQNYSRFDSVTNIDRGFDAAPFFGLGVGYNVNNWFRIDVTGEYRARANFHGLDIGFTSADGFTPDRYTASKYEWTGLLNGYVDLGTWWNFTPFVGAGFGFTRNTITNFSDVTIHTLAGTTSDSHSSDVSKWNFAWALYAGVGYRVTPAVTLELAYRYLDLGNASTGTMIDYTFGGFDTPFEFRHLTSHDLKLGLRYNFGTYDYLPPPPPPLRSRG